MPRIFKTTSDWKKFRESIFFNNKTLGLIPTMGALHQGHISLIKKSKAENDLTLVSIFVNPTQFNDKGDFIKYPLSYQSDLKILNDLETDFLFYPGYQEIYPDNFQYRVIETKTSKTLCGKSRPGHFEGVLTVVMKLLNIAKANQAYFGEKDFQQYLLVKGMCEAFFIDTKIVPCPTVRESSGLAMSSRNVHLTQTQRELAAKFSKFLASEKSINEIISDLQNSGFTVDYVTDFSGHRLGAVKIGSVRLIDNVKI